MGKPVCPRCGSPNVATERRPNGNHLCTACRHKWPNRKPENVIRPMPLRVVAPEPVTPLAEDSPAYQAMAGMVESLPGLYAVVVVIDPATSNGHVLVHASTTAGVKEIGEKALYALALYLESLRIQPPSDAG